MATFISHSPAETVALGETWGREAQPGRVIGLSGELGAGKTQLVKGVARGLGVTARIHSPTFTLVNTYAGGRLILYHLDFYRLDSRQEILAAGLEEFLHPDGVTVIEWAERWFGAITPGSGAPGDLVLPNSLTAAESTPLSEAAAASQPGARQLRLVQLETLGENERRIIYDDPGA